MRAQHLTQLSLWAAAAFAFQDTSPFFLFSSSNLPTVDSIPVQQVAQSSQITNSVLKALESCPSKTYIIVSQPGVSAADFGGPYSVPRLRSRIAKEDESTISTYVVPEVVGKVDISSIERHLSDNCGVKRVEVDAKAFASGGSMSVPDEYPQLISINSPSLPSSPNGREAQLGTQDFFLDWVLRSVSGYTVIYTTTPPTPEVLEMQNKQAASKQHSQQLYEWDADMMGDSIHMDLKRDTQGHLHINKRQSGDNSSDRGLFEKYNFFSAGIFTGFFVAFILVSILYVGMSALGGVEVSYGAFTKEMGPKSQPKQQ